MMRRIVIVALAAGMLSTARAETGAVYRVIIESPGPGRIGYALRICDDANKWMTSFSGGDRSGTVDPIYGEWGLSLSDRGSGPRAGKRNDRQTITFATNWTAQFTMERTTLNSALAPQTNASQCVGGTFERASALEYRIVMDKALEPLIKESQPTNAPYSDPAARSQKR